METLNVNKVTAALKKGGFKKFVQDPSVAKRFVSPIASGYQARQVGRTAVDVLFFTVRDRENDVAQDAERTAALDAMRVFLTNAGYTVNGSVILTVTLN